MDAHPNPDQIIGDIARMGRIASVAAGKCTVVIGDMTTPPLPWFAVRAGRVSKWSPPTRGEQCLVICPEGDTASGIVFPGIYSAKYPAPASNPDIEVTLYADGASISYDQSAHALSATLPSGGTATITANGGIKITGDVEITGKLSVSKSVTAEDDVTGGGISLKTHVHASVKTGTDLSGKPQ